MNLTNIPMVNLVDQYRKIQKEIDEAIHEVVQSGWFIKGPKVKSFEDDLASYLGCKHVIACGNGTDALQIAMMALELSPGDEVIVPAFTYAATAEVIALLGLVPVMVDVNKDSFNIDPYELMRAITHKTKAIIPVHLFGQSSNMESILEIAKNYNLHIVEDNAQSIGTELELSTHEKIKTGTIGDIGCTSFFPSKNLGCFGDGGALTTNNDELAEKIRRIGNHGQSSKYHHEIIGINSRLDAIQAAVLSVKLKYLDQYNSKRQVAAQWYDERLQDINEISIPSRKDYSSHVFHQYTLQVKKGKRDELQRYLKEMNISSTVYYPVPLYKQKAYENYYDGHQLTNTEYLCDSVLSIPMHTELTEEIVDYITQSIRSFYGY